MNINALPSYKVIHRHHDGLFQGCAQISRGEGGGEKKRGHLLNGNEGPFVFNLIGNLNSMASFASPARAQVSISILTAVVINTLKLYEVISTISC